MKPRPTIIAPIGGKPRPIPRPTTPRRALAAAAVSGACLAVAGCGLLQGASTRVTPAASRVDVTTTTEVEVNPPKQKEEACDSSSSD